MSTFRGQPRRRCLLPWRAPRSPKFAQPAAPPPKCKRRHSASVGRSAGPSAERSYKEATTMYPQFVSRCDSGERRRRPPPKLNSRPHFAVAPFLLPPSCLGRRCGIGRTPNKYGELRVTKNSLGVGWGGPFRGAIYFRWCSDRAQNQADTPQVPTPRDELKYCYMRCPYTRRSLG